MRMSLYLPMHSNALRAHLSWRTVFRKHRAVVLEKARRVVVDILDCDGQCCRRRLRRIAVICNHRIGGFNACFSQW